MNDQDFATLTFQNDGPPLLVLGTTDALPLHTRLCEIKRALPDAGMAPFQVRVVFDERTAYKEKRGQILVKVLRMAQFDPLCFIGPSDPVEAIAFQAKVPYQAAPVSIEEGPVADWVDVRRLADIPCPAFVAPDPPAAAVVVLPSPPPLPDLSPAEPIEASTELDVPLVPAEETQSPEVEALLEAPVEATSLALCYRERVRSGQSVHAPGRDLIATQAVSPGAQVSADGHVHVYGALRGQAMAGASGDRQARIFALNFQAEMVAIAGCYRVFESLPANLAGQAVEIWLEDDGLRFAALGEDAPSLG